MALIFDELSHSYRLDGIPLPGASELVSSIKPPFDAAGNAARMAARDGTDPEALLRQWDEKRDKACVLGHLVHSLIEETIKGANVTGGPPQFRHWLRWWEGAEKHLEPVAIEHRMGSHRYAVAGTCDLIARSRKTGELHLLDWKSNERFETGNQWRRTLLAPFDDLPDCELSAYSIQLSIYQNLAEEEFGEPFGDSWLLHASDRALTPHRCHRLGDRVAEWLVGRVAAVTP